MDWVLQARASVDTLHFFLFSAEQMMFHFQTVNDCNSQSHELQSKRCDQLQLLSFPSWEIAQYFYSCSYSNILRRSQHQIIHQLFALSCSCFYKNQLWVSLPLLEFNNQFSTLFQWLSLVHDHFEAIFNLKAELLAPFHLSRTLQWITQL